jgi:hypothetical protein
MRPTDTAGVADPPVRVACTVPPCMPCPHVHSATQVTPAAPAAAPAAAAGEKRGRPVAREGSPTGEPPPLPEPSLPPSTVRSIRHVSKKNGRRLGPRSTLTRAIGLHHDPLACVQATRRGRGAGPRAQTGGRRLRRPSRPWRRRVGAALRRRLRAPRYRTGRPPLLLPCATGVATQAGRSCASTAASGASSATRATTGRATTTGPSGRRRGSGGWPSSMGGRRRRPTSAKSAAQCGRRARAGGSRTFVRRAHAAGTQANRGATPSRDPHSHPWCKHWHARTAQ